MYVCEHMMLQSGMMTQLSCICERNVIVTRLICAALFTGIFKHSQNISKSYLADITSKSDQSSKMGNFNAWSSIGFILGPPVGGHLAEIKGGFYVVSLLAGIIFMLNFGRNYTLYTCMCVTVPRTFKIIVRRT